MSARRLTTVLFHRRGGTRDGWRGEYQIPSRWGETAGGGHPHQRGCAGRTAFAAARPRAADNATPSRVVRPHASIACAIDAPNTTYACAHAALA